MLTVTTLALHVLTDLLLLPPALLVTRPGLKNCSRALNAEAHAVSSGDRSTILSVNSAMLSVSSARPIKMCALSVVSQPTQSGSTMSVSLHVHPASTALLITLGAIYVQLANSPAIPAPLRLSVLLVLRMPPILRNYSKVLSALHPALLRPMFKLVTCVSPVTQTARPVVQIPLIARPVTLAGFSSIMCAMRPTVPMATMRMAVTSTV